MIKDERKYLYTVMKREKGRLTKCWSCNGDWATIGVETEYPTAKAAAFKMLPFPTDATTSSSECKYTGPSLSFAWKLGLINPFKLVFEEEDDEVGQLEPFWTKREAKPDTRINGSTINRKTFDNEDEIVANQFLNPSPPISSEFYHKNIIAKFNGACLHPHT